VRSPVLKSVSKRSKPQLQTPQSQTSIRHFQP
jgi:hypothetical protein